MTSDIAVMPERTERRKLAPTVSFVSRFGSDPIFPIRRQLKPERIMRAESKRSVCISSRRMARMDPDGQERIYCMEFHPHERKMIETGPNGKIAEYKFDFGGWRELARTNRLGAKMLYFYYRDIFGNPDKPSMDFDYLGSRYGLDRVSLGHAILDAERIVCRFRLLNNTAE
jgi:hypothetical protein